jgi:hypothetical protein
VGTWEGTAFSATVLIGPPLGCPLDETDPVDDVPTGATLLLADREQRGRLCPDDVDNLLFEFAPSDDFSIDGAPEDVISFQRAAVDEAASLAAGHVVASGVVGDTLTTLDGAVAGTYIMRLAAPSDQVDFLQWSVTMFQGCDRDPGDSLVDGLDNSNVAFAENLVPGVALNLHFCSDGDRDLVIIDPAGNTGPITLAIDGPSENVNVEFFAFDGGALGEPLPFTVEDDGFDSRVDLGALPAPIAMRVSRPTDGDEEMRFDLAALQSGDTCSNALPLVENNATSGSKTGDATLYNDDHNAAVLGDCTGYTSPGADTVFAVDLDADATLELLAVPLLADVDDNGLFDDGDGPDVAVYILKDCDLTETSCVAGFDEGGRDTSEVLAFTNDGPAATFFVVVDSFRGENYTWQLDWSISAP